MRKFTSTTGFADGARHIEYEGQQGTCVLKDGTRSPAADSLDDALQYVADGLWREVLPAKRYTHRSGFQCAYVEFLEGQAYGFGTHLDGTLGSVTYDRDQAADAVERGTWVEVPAKPEPLYSVWRGGQGGDYKNVPASELTDDERRLFRPAQAAQTLTCPDPVVDQVLIEGRPVEVTYKNGRYWAKVEDDCDTTREWHAKTLGLLQERINDTAGKPAIVGVVLQERGETLKYGFMYCHAWPHAEEAATEHWQLKDYQHVLTYELDVMMYWLDTWKTPHTLFDATLPMEAK